MFVAIPEPKIYNLSRRYAQMENKKRLRENGQAITVERKPIHPNKHAIPCT